MIQDISARPSLSGEDRRWLRRASDAGLKADPGLMAETAASCPDTLKCSPDGIWYSGLAAGRFIELDRSGRLSQDPGVLEDILKAVHEVTEMDARAFLFVLAGMSMTALLTLTACWPRSRRQDQPFYIGLCFGRMLELPEEERPGRDVSAALSDLLKPFRRTDGEPTLL